MSNYKSCSKCGTTFSIDDDDNVVCNEEFGGCGKVWCSYECADADRYSNESCKLEESIYEGKPEGGSCEFATEDYSGDMSCEECENYIPDNCRYCKDEFINEGEM